MRKARLILPMAVASLALSGCDDWDWGEFFTGESGRAELELQLSAAAPADEEIESVVIRLRGVELRAADGSRETLELSQPQDIDLLALRGSASRTVFGRERLPAGDYDSLRLLIDAQARPGDTNVVDSFVQLRGDATPQTLRLSNGSVMLVHELRLRAGERRSYTVELDLHRSLSVTADGYRLQPALRVARSDRAAHLEGRVAAGLVEAFECDGPQGRAGLAAVYVYQGHDAVLQPVAATNGAPLASAQVEADDDGGYRYRLGFLAAEDYTLALTCQPSLDGPAGAAAGLNIDRASNVSLGTGDNRYDFDD